MLVILIRVVIIYLIVLLFLRLMGKRQIGQMQPYEVVITLIIADLATVPMSDLNIPLVNGILPLAVLVLLHFLITLLTRKFIRFRRMLSGNPEVVISPNGIEYKTLKKLNINLDDLCEMLRLSGYYNFNTIRYAIIETNGEISVIPKAENAPVTAGDLKVKNEEPTIPTILISDGKIVKKSIAEFSLSEKSIKKICNDIGAKEIKDILFVSLDENKTLTYQLKNHSIQIKENYKVA